MIRRLFGRTGLLLLALSVLFFVGVAGSFQPVPAVAAPAPASPAPASPAPTPSTDTPEPSPTPTPDSDYTGILGEIQEKIASIISWITSIGNNVQSISNMIVNGSWLEPIMTWGEGIAVQGLTILLDLFSSVMDPDAVFSAAPIRVLLSFAARFGWLLFVLSGLLAILEVGIQYKTNQSIADTVKTVALNLFKAFIAVQLFTTVPVPLYKLTVHLQNSVIASLGLTNDLSDAGSVASDTIRITLENMGMSIATPIFSLLLVVLILVYVVCGIKVLSATIKRSGILLVLMLIGSLHMFSIPRGYWDPFWSWCKQVVALCITSFCQCVLYFASFSIISSYTSGAGNLALVFGSMSLALVACEVPRIADRFGMDSSIHGNLSSAANSAAAAARAAASLKMLIAAA